MQILLLQDVKNVGKKGQIKNVPDGYARNFLIAKKFAAAANPLLISEVKREEERKKRQTESEKQEAQKLAESLRGKEFVIKVRAKNGKLFGSITAREIAFEIKKTGIEIPEKAIEINHIKELGKKNISIDLGFGIKSAITVSLEEA